MPPDGDTAHLRLAESLLHEAMHLQLSLIERHVPMSEDGVAGGYSPWQQRERPVLGLLHGLYVFSAIRGWFERVAARCADPSADRRHALRRLDEIAAEIDAVAGLPAMPGLTEAGRDLAHRLLSRHAAGAS